MLVNFPFAAVTELLQLCLKILVQPLSWKHRICLKLVVALEVLAALAQRLRSNFFSRGILTIKLIYQIYTHQNAQTYMIPLWELFFYEWCESCVVYPLQPFSYKIRRGIPRTGNGIAMSVSPECGISGTGSGSPNPAVFRVEDKAPEVQSPLQITLDVEPQAEDVESHVTSPEVDARSYTRCYKRLRD